MTQFRVRALQVLMLVLLFTVIPLAAVSAEPPSNFNLTYPVNGHNYPPATMPFPLTFTWEPAANTTHYTFRLVFGGDLENGTVFVNNVVTTDTFYTLTLAQQAQLAPGALLSWSVLATNGNTGETLTKTANFSLDFSSAPQNFSLTAPANNATVPLTDPFTFTWAASTGSTGYIFNLNGVVQDAITTQTFYTLTAEQQAQIQNGQTYIWSVAATNGYMGQNLTRSASFTAALPLGDFNLTFPVNSYYAPSLLPFPMTFTWEPAANATSYTFRFGMGNDAQTGELVAEGVVTTPSFALTPAQQSRFAPATPMFWSVTATNAATGETLTKNGHLSITFSPQPQDFTLTTPANNSNTPLTNPFTFTWTASPYATGYIFNLNGVIQDATTTQTSYTLTAEQRAQLQVGNTYSWSVAATNGYMSQNLVQNASFTVNPPPPAPQMFTQLTPAEGSSYTTATLPNPLTFTWSASTNAIGYYFALSNGGVIVPPTFTTETSYTLSAAERAALLPNHTYSWLVKATNGGSAEDIALDADFTVTPAPPEDFDLTYPTPGSTSLVADLPFPMTFTWESSANATSYTFTLTRELAPGVTPIVVIDQAVTTSPSYTLTTDQHANFTSVQWRYVWTVTASNSESSTVVTKTGINYIDNTSPQPGSFNLISPAGDSDIAWPTLPNPFTFFWEAAPNATGYIFNLDGIVHNLTTTQTSYTLSQAERLQLQLGGSYDWSVTATNGFFNVNITQSGHFNITATPEDAIEYAHVISTVPFSYNVNTSGTTTLPSDPSTYCLSADQATTSVWFRLDATENETLIFDTATSDYDTVMTVYAGSDPLNLAFVNCAEPPSKVVFQADAGQTYYVMVNRKVNTSEGVLRLTVQAMYSPPTLISPVNGAGVSGNPPTLQWEAVSGANAYQIELTEVASGTSTTYFTENSTGMVLPDALLETTYSWRVLAINNVPGTNGVSRYSEAQTFTITSLPSDVPSLNLTFTNLPEFTWSVVDWAWMYHFELATSSSFGSSIIFTMTTPQTHTLSGIELAPGVYYWRVCALRNEVDTCTRWSATQTLTVGR